MNRTYTDSVQEHCRVHLEALNDLSDTLSARELTFHERNSAERSIQIVVEACIGLSKHCCRKAGKTVLGDATAGAIASLELFGPGVISADDLRGAIGMRNAIVHDYLNLDWGLIEEVIRERYYQRLQSYIDAAIGFLLTED